MDVPLDNTEDETPVAKTHKSKGKGKLGHNDDEPIEEVVKFLTKWESAKIVVVVETHCLESGVLIWKGNEPANYETCSLFEVSMCYLCAHQVANTYHRSSGIASPPRSSSTYQMEMMLHNTATRASS